MQVQPYLAPPHPPWQVACTNATAAVPSGTPVVVPSKGAKQQKEGGKAWTTPGPQASAPTPGGLQPGQGVAQQPAQNTSAAAAGEQQQPEEEAQQQQQQGTASDSGGGGGEPAPPAGVPSGGGGNDWPGDLDDYADDQAPGTAPFGTILRSMQGKPRCSMQGNYCSMQG